VSVDDGMIEVARKVPFTDMRIEILNIGVINERVFVERVDHFTLHGHSNPSDTLRQLVRT